MLENINKPINIKLASRLSQLPPYLFVEIDRKKKQAISRGIDIINLGIGDPDGTPPAHIIDALIEGLKNPSNHRYPESEGLEKFREACCNWYKERFSVDLDPTTECISLIGAKEGIGHLPFALVDPGETVLIPDPAYPVYNSGTIFAGGKPYNMPLKKENNFLPNLEEIPSAVADKSKLMFINYPNNPTGAVAPISFYEKVVNFAQKHNIIVAQDNTYSEISYDECNPPSLLQVKGAKEIGIEFHSLSKTFNMTGWRIGFVVGRADIIDALRKVKSNLDSGAFQAIQEAGVAALSNKAIEFAAENSLIYKERRDILISGLKEVGLKVDYPKATFYVWCEVPTGFNSSSFVEFLIDKAGIVCTPGRGFGQYGEGYVRFALTANSTRIKEAVERIKKSLA